jgi:hypothetical protein
MSTLIDEYKRKFIDYFKQDARFECTVAFDHDCSCMLYLDVKKSENREAIRLRENKITSWPAGDEIMEDMTEDGFKRFIEKWEYCTGNMLVINEYNSDDRKLGGIVWIEEKRLSEQEILAFWEQTKLNMQTNVKNVYYLTFETFFGDVKFRFKRENDGWVRIE